MVEKEPPLVQHEDLEDMDDFDDDEEYQEDLAASIKKIKDQGLCLEY